MEPESQRKGIHRRVRLVIAAALNIALLAYVLPRIDHLRDIRDYRYATASSLWIYATVVVPTVTLMILFPLLRASSRFQRWLVIGLSIFPAFLALVGWWQLLEVWVAGR